MYLLYIGNLQEANTSKLRTADNIVGPNAFLQCTVTSNERTLRKPHLENAATPSLCPFYIPIKRMLQQSNFKICLWYASTTNHPAAVFKTPYTNPNTNLILRLLSCDNF